MVWEVLASIPDHRRPEGRRYLLVSILFIAVAAMLADRRDQLGVVRRGRRRLSREALETIGIGRGRVPAPSVWCELFQQLDMAMKLASVLFTQERVRAARNASLTGGAPDITEVSSAIGERPSTLRYERGARAAFRRVLRQSPRL